MDLFKNLDITTILITILIPVIFASFLLKFDLYEESMYYEEEVKFYGSKVISIENINSGESFNKLLTFECDSILRTVVMNINELKNIKINDVLTFKAKRKNIATNDNKLSKDIQRYKLKCSIINCIFFWFMCHVYYNVCN